MRFPRGVIQCADPQKILVLPEAGRDIEFGVFGHVTGDSRQSRQKKDKISKGKEAWLAKLDFVQENGLLSLNNEGTYVGSGGFGYTGELPRKDFEGKMAPTCEMWGSARAKRPLPSPRICLPNSPFSISIPFFSALD